jgi:hypothetical protein
MQSERPEWSGRSRSSSFTTGVRYARPRDRSLFREPGLGRANRPLNDLVDRLLSSQLGVGCIFSPATEPFTSDLTGTASFGPRKIPARIANPVRRFKVASLFIRWCNTLVSAFVEQKAMSLHKFVPLGKKLSSTPKAVQLGEHNFALHCVGPLGSFFWPFPRPAHVNPFSKRPLSSRLT